MRHLIAKLLLLTLTLAAFTGEHASRAEPLVYQTEQPGVFLKHQKVACPFQVRKRSTGYVISRNTLSRKLFERSLICTAIVNQTLREQLKLPILRPVLTITHLPKSHLATPEHPARFIFLV